jgi:hypothetical protein
MKLKKRIEREYLKKELLPLFKKPFFVLYDSGTVCFFGTKPLLTKSLDSGFFKKSPFSRLSLFSKKTNTTYFFFDTAASLELFMSKHKNLIPIFFSVKTVYFLGRRSYLFYSLDSHNVVKRFSRLIKSGSNGSLRLKG